jgi:hypothetical protein
MILESLVLSAPSEKAPKMYYDFAAERGPLPTGRSGEDRKSPCDWLGNRSSYVVGSTPLARKLVVGWLVWFGFGLVGFSFDASLGPNEGPERGAALRKPLLLTTLFGTRRNIPRIQDPILGPHVRLGAG